MLPSKFVPRKLPGFQDRVDVLIRTVDRCESLHIQRSRQLRLERQAMAIQGPEIAISPW
jgi:hypothetical protein